MTSTGTFQNPTIEQLMQQLALFEAYLNLKIEQRDWHGVADAAMDIREVEAMLKILRNK